MDKGLVLYFGILFYGIMFALTGDFLFTRTFFLSFLASSLFLFISKKLDLPKKYFLIINIMLWLDLFGRIYFYSNLFYYDKILHLISPFLVTYMFFDYFKDYQKTFVFVLISIASWEVFEFILDVLFDSKQLGVFSKGVFVMSPLFDTIVDLLLGVFSAVVYLSYVNIDNFLNKDNLI